MLKVIFHIWNAKKSKNVEMWKSSFKENSFKGFHDLYSTFLKQSLLRKIILGWKKLYLSINLCSKILFHFQLEGLSNLYCNLILHFNKCDWEHIDCLIILQNISVYRKIKIIIVDNAHNIGFNEKSSKGYWLNIFV